MVQSDMAINIMSDQDMAILQANRAINALNQMRVHLESLGIEANEVKFMRAYLVGVISEVGKINVDERIF